MLEGTRIKLISDGWVFVSVPEGWLVRKQVPNRSDALFWWMRSDRLWLSESEWGWNNAYHFSTGPGFHECPEEDISKFCGQLLEMYMYDTSNA